MKKIAVLAVVYFIIVSTQLKAQKGITIAMQYNSQTINYKGTTPDKDLGNGFGIGINITERIGPVELLVEPRLMLYSHRTNSNAKTQYIQLPVSINLLSFAKKFVDDEVNVGSVKSFKFGLNVGLYGAYAIGGKYNGSTKLLYGESSTDNRSPLDYGLHTSLSFGSNVSSFRGYIQVQRGFNNVIPIAKVNNDTRKLNSFNVGVSFRLKNKFFRK